jgi:hypothetical protein
LDELAVGDIDVRSRVADEWGQLDERRRAVLSHLACLPLSGWFTVEEAHMLLGCDPGRTQRELELLIEAGAVVSQRDDANFGAAVYCIPRLIHLFAREVRNVRRSASVLRLSAVDLVR